MDQMIVSSANRPAPTEAADGDRLLERIKGRPGVAAPFGLCASDWPRPAK
jgi:hypothetical protein